MKMRFKVLFITIILISIQVAAQDTSGVGIPAYLNLPDPEPWPLLQAGLNVNVGIWHDNPGYPYDGEGIKIGILDRDFRRSSLEALQDHITFAPGWIDSLIVNDSNTDHGTKVLEVAASIAPKATFYPCGYNTLLDYQHCIILFTQLQDSVDVIIHSAGVPVLSTNGVRDGTSDWSSAAILASEAGGIVWINSVGNYNQGVIEGEFKEDEMSRLHLFEIGDNSGTYIVPTIPAPSDTVASFANIYLNWYSEHNDTQLVIDIHYTERCSSDGCDVSSESLSRESRIEHIRVDLSLPFQLSIRHVDGNIEGTRFLLVAENIGFRQADDSSPNYVIAPADNPSVIAVGALSTKFPYDEIARYSSFGIFPFDTTGQDSSTQIPVSKPDIVTLGGILFPQEDAAIFDKLDFSGTSVSAAIVGGTVALILQAYPDSEPNQIRDYLRENASIRLNQDPNNEQSNSVAFGWGKLWLPSPPPTPVRGTEIPTAIPNEPLGSVIAKITTSVGNIRGGPGISCQLIMTGQKDQEFSVVGVDRQMDWYQISTERGDLWIYAGIAKIIRGDINSVEQVPASPCQVIEPSPTLTAISPTTTTPTVVVSRTTPPTITPTLATPEPPFYTWTPSPTPRPSNTPASPINHNPVANNDSFSVSVGGTIDVCVSDLLSNDSDPDGDALSFTDYNNFSSNHGTVVRNGDCGTYTATSAGVDSAGYTISDGRGGTASATVTITINP
ncbi:MAG: S8 family serine peptidase [Anaerolineae bacterium]|nr:S8 family serine peptidase [Anaerolineae bacterium]